MDWKSVRLEPANIVLASPGATQRYLVTGLNGADLEDDLTASPACMVTSSRPDVVAVDREHGLLVAKSPGQADIKVVWGQVTHVSMVRVENRPAEMTVNFSPGIISILTIKGCNGSGCHGSPAGQAGFKLSLFGYDIQADREMIVTAGNGRRVNLQDPEQSLILRKPSFAVPHGGGRVLPKDSDEYRTILDWLKQGAKLDSGGAQLTRLELYPAETILQQGRAQRLVAIGRLSDGTTRDMTKEVRYVSGDEALAKVATDGMVTATARGLTTVMARGMGRVATVQVGVVTTPQWQRAPVTAANFIDELAGDKLYRLQMTPAPLSSDREFIRRVYLDTIGLLPTV
ncbi:MAG TPA: Ig-like domain-containing protein, partial [Bryobacteraceae bacterium]|nr:Ig-like domain-containing protein [Bryobacteraceae bacterium]